VLSLFLRILLRCLLRVRVAGDVASLASGRTLIVANYDSLLDGILIGLFLPGAVTVAVTPAELRNPLVRLMCAQFRTWWSTRRTPWR
jgi:acyl-[acyl-carrier-protein]-phospholipid O-acyltransferase/long-chain-fatty-acid--[acyl-carrier-protein] ligase